MTEHLAELVGGSQDGRILAFDPIVERLCDGVTREVHEWNGEEPVKVPGGWLRRFVYVKEEA